MNGSRRPGARVALALALVVAGCSRDLTLTVPTAPSITALSPTRAYAGQLVTIAGSNFDKDPAANVVLFPLATARAHLATATGIVVRVPDAAGSGTVSVTTGGGTSNALPGFVYLGAGQLRDIRVANEVPLLHKPRRVLSIGETIYLDSALNSGVLQLDQPSFFAPGGARQVPTAGGNLLFTMDYDGVLRRVDVVGGGPTVSRTVDVDLWDNIGYVRRTAGDRLVAVGPLSPTSTDTLAIWTLDPTTLATITGPTATPTWISNQPQDAGNGQLVLVTLASPPGAQLKLAVIDTSGATPTYAEIPSGGHVFDRNTVALGTGLGSIGPPTPATIHRLAAVGLSNGNIAIADLDLPSPAFAATEIVTYSPSPVEALFFTPDGQLLASKPDDDIILGIDLATRVVTWSVQATQPTRMAARLGLIYVASRADNLVTILDPVAQRQVGAVRADVIPGSSDAYAGLAFMPGTDNPAWAQYLPDALYFPTSHPAALLRYGLGYMSPLVSTTTFTPLFTFMDPNGGALWAAGPSEVGPPDIVPPDVYPLPAAPRKVAFTPVHVDENAVPQDTGHLLVGHDFGLSLFQSGLIGGLQWPGVTMDLSTFSSVGFLPAGAAYATVGLWRTTAYCDALVAWTLDRLKAADSALHGGWFCDPTTGKGRITATAVLEDGLWLFSDDEQGELGSTVAYLVDPAWNGEATVPTIVGHVQYAPSLSNALQSPNGRTIVHWERGFRSGTDLHFNSADPATSFAEIGFLHFEATISGFTFDAKGERLFLVTRNPDRLYIIE
jgi:hypothetical protein